MVSASMLAQIKARLSDYLTDSCTIEAEAVEFDEYGASSHRWAVVASGVACRVIDAGTRNTTAYGVVGNAEALVERYRLIVPAGTALGVDQRVTVGGVVYTVVDVIDRRTDAADAQAILSRVKS